MNATTTLRPSASSPHSVDGPSAITSRNATRSPSRTIGFWLMQVFWLLRCHLVGPDHRPVHRLLALRRNSLAPSRHEVARETRLRADRRIGLRDDLFFFGERRQVIDVVAHLAAAHAAVRRLDEAVVVDARE